MVALVTSARKGIRSYDERRGREEMKVDPLKPELSLLIKIGSAVVHAKELCSPKGHPFDKAALDSILSDPEVIKWIKDMGPFLPLER